MNNNANDIYQKFHELSDEQYLELLCRAEQEPVIDGVVMPGFPDEAFQKGSVGSAGGRTLRHEGFKFYSTIKRYASEFGVTLDSNTAILDFGVGWGRMIRFFYKDIPSEGIFGIDVMPEMVDVCKKTLPSGKYSVSSPLPPTGFADNSFDIIFAYSVFSHLRDDAAEAWIKEFSRILKPNGIVVATTEGKAFLDKCEYYQKHPEKAADSIWHQMISEGFSPIEKFREKFDNGEFSYVAFGGGGVLDGSFYGDCVIPPQYVENVFGKYLIFKDYDEALSYLPQAVFVLQKG